MSATGFEPIKPRKVFLSDFTVQRLGGAQAAEVMRLQLEEQKTDLEIMEQLSLSAEELSKIVNDHVWMRERKAQKLLLERTARQVKQKNIAAQKKPKPDKLPPALRNIQLPKGISPTEYAIKRISQVTPEAVEKLVWLMHNSRNDSIQYNSATKLLGLNGIVEVEKSISVIADAEAIIRELNRRGPYKPRGDEPIEAEIVSEGRTDGPGDSAASSPHGE